MNCAGQCVKFNFKDGVTDPWGKNKKFGIRNIQIFGRLPQISENYILPVSPDISFQNLTEELEPEMFSIICHSGCETNSDCSKRRKNLSDSSGSEWWCPGPAADIKIGFSISFLNFSLKFQIYPNELTLKKFE